MTRAVCVGGGRTVYVCLQEQSATYLFHKAGTAPIFAALLSLLSPQARACPVIIDPFHHQRNVRGQLGRLDRLASSVGRVDGQGARRGRRGWRTKGWGGGCRCERPRYGRLHGTLLVHQAVSVCVCVCMS